MHVLSLFRSRFHLTLMVIMIALISAFPAFAQSSNITIDTGQFVDAINTWLPMAVGIITIGVGIAGAFALAKFVGKMIIDALSGRLA